MYVFMCMDISHSVYLYINQIFSLTEPKFLELRQALPVSNMASSWSEENVIPWQIIYMTACATFSSDQEEAMLETGKSLS